MEKATSSIADRLSMHLLFDKMYTRKEKRPPLKAIILLSDMDIAKLEDVTRERRKLAEIYNLNLKQLEPNLYGLYLKKLIRRETTKGYAILDTSQEGVWIAFCNEKSYFVTRALLRLFNSLYPSVSRLYLNYSQIRTLLEIVKEEYVGQTTMTFFTVKREPKRTESPFRERGTFQLWEENAQEELLKQSKDYRLMVDRVDFEVRDKERKMVLLQGHVSRRGVCKLKFGDFTSFYKNLVLKAVDLGLNWKRFYSHRARTIIEGKVLLKPFGINYEFELDKQQMRTLADRISTSYSTSIVHSGNPYFAANLCDYNDGSSFGITALCKVVTITPIMIASPQSSWKLANRIQEILGDGEISSVLR